MGILVTNPGIFTTVQDEGRLRLQQYGVSPSGPMDARSFHAANILVGNERTEGALEITFSGPTLQFDEDNIIAITGGNMQPKLNGSAFPMNRAVLVHGGDELSFGFAVNGVRGYIAFAGGLDVPLVMGSKSTLVSKHLGGIEGRALQKGDRIGFVSPRTTLPHMERRVLTAREYPTKEIVLRAIPGPQDFEFSREELRKFFWYGAEITNEFDRMGCRLQREEPLHHLKDGNIISDGIAAGSVQVPTNGQPIIMLADRQTVGGYTKIATVISSDLPKIAQARPGMHIRFVSIDIDFAQDIYIADLKEMDAFEKEMEG